MTNPTMALIDYLRKLDRKHLVDPPEAAKKSGLKIELPGVARCCVQCCTASPTPNVVARRASQACNLAILMSILWR